MIRKYFGIVAVAIIGAMLLNVSSCARSRKLESITIQPSGQAWFGAVDPSLYFQYKALGNYIHPPSTLDITSQVTWQSNNPQVIQITGPGVASPNTNCGVAQVFAEMHDSGSDVVSNYAQITVYGPASLGCTPAGAAPVLTINFAGSGTGTVTGAGVSCTAPTACTYSLTAGTTLNLTATPTGASTFGGWSGCSSSTGSACSLTIENNVTVTATFN
ncbi:MAG TPA: hypothetical protein VGS27_21375 [Candidatus Sulfotelmatobacter sp.]|nr:hypothetical protein [Candidatus Sulfotelmatobacter sp.]